MCNFHLIYLFLLVPSFHGVTIDQHPAWRMLNQFDCGDSEADRIIGGTNAKLGQFPWIARIGYPDDEGGSETLWQCGGVLIGNRHIVTAAHCFFSNEEKLKPFFYGKTDKRAYSPPDGNRLPSLMNLCNARALSIMIRLGEYNINTNPDCEIKRCAPPVQDIRVKSWKIHPLFNKPAFHNDIAIIEMERPAVLNDYITPICLPKTREQRKVFVKGEFVMTAGWGKTNMTTEESADILQVLSLPIVKPEACNELGKHFKISSSEICAGKIRNRDACTGDSGGPLMKVFDTIEGPKNVLVGVVSFGPLICGSEKPGVYTSVSYFLNWILDTIL